MKTTARSAPKKSAIKSLAHGSVTDTEAIDSAYAYLASKARYLDGASAFRLEEIRKAGKKWIVVLSYNTKFKETKEKNPLARALNNLRRFKQFEIDIRTGEIVAMGEPIPR